MEFPPPNIHFSFLLNADANAASLSPEEQELSQKIKNTNARTSFIAGRVAARKVLNELGVDSRFPLLRATSGAAAWPDSIVGSISHNRLAAVSVAARSEHARALGIDLENADRKVTKGIERKILTQIEEQWVATSPTSRDERVLALFSAKEAIFKALSTLGSGMFWFKDVALSELSSEGIAGVSFASNIDGAVLQRCGLKTGPKVDVLKMKGFLVSFVLVR